MGNYKKYLHIKVESAGLIVEEIKQYKLPQNIKNKIDELKNASNGEKYYAYKGDNIIYPFKVENISNMLSALMNIRTVPTKPCKYDKIPQEIQLLRPQICDAIAKTGFYKIDTYYSNDDYVEQIIGDDGEYYNIYKKVFSPKIIGGTELFKGYKTALNSNTMQKTIFPQKEGAKSKVMKGIYTYEMLSRYFGDNNNHPLLLKIKSFINKILEVENFQENYTFVEMANAIEEAKKSPLIYDAINDFVLSIKEDWENVAKLQGGNACFPIWMYAIFGWVNPNIQYKNNGASTSSNTDLKSNGNHSCTYVRLHRDVNHYKISLYGELIFKITDPKIEEYLRKGRGAATILDGGLCTIVGLTNFEPETNFEENWLKIL